jgi:hypothetical protein
MPPLPSFPLYLKRFELFGFICSAQRDLPENVAQSERVAKGQEVLEKPSAPKTAATQHLLDMVGLLAGEAALNGNVAALQKRLDMSPSVSMESSVMIETSPGGKAPSQRRASHGAGLTKQKSGILKHSGAHPPPKEPSSGSSAQRAPRRKSTT